MRLPLDRVRAQPVDVDAVRAAATCFDARRIGASGVEVVRHEPRSYRSPYARPVHRPGTWRCDFVATDAACAVRGGFVQLVLPSDGPAWYWAYLVGEDLGVVTVRDHDVPRPRGEDLTVRAEGLWAELVCEVPGVHWTIGLEAFGVRLDEPAEALRGEIGERVAVGLDVEWDEGVVFGDVLVGTDTIAFDGTGSFTEHDGPAVRVSTEGLDATFDRDGLPTNVTMRSGERAVPVEVLGVVVIPGAVDGAPLVRVLGRWEPAARPAEAAWLDLVPPGRADG